MREHNQTTLQEALSKLPVYSPPVECWKEIDRALAGRAREAPLHRAIEALPGYAPSPKTWENISAGLAAEASAQMLQQALQDLPRYSPPKKTWEGIQEKIDRPARRIYWPALAKVAAAAALLTALWWTWPAGNSTDQASASYAYTQETTDSPFYPEADWEQDDQLMQKAVQAFRRDPVAQQLPEYELLLAEWSALKTAQEEVKNMMERYGKDARLVRQMTDIERERSGLIREMIAQI